MRPALAMALSFAILSPGIARASLSDDAAAVEQRLREKGAEIARRETLFLEEGHVASVSVDGEGACVTLVALSARSVSFAGVAAREAEPADALIGGLATRGGERRIESTSGAVLLAGCGAAAPRGALLSMTSARGAIEIIVARSDEAIAVAAAIVGRDVGPTAPRGDPGPPLLPGPLAERRRRADERARAEGATNVLAIEAKAGPAGAGEVGLRLPAGCHRLDAMAELTVSPAGLVPAIDLDVELRDGTSSEPVARDRGETPDARVEACVAETTELTLSFHGAPAHARVVIHDAVWPMPAWIPSRWGSRARAALAMTARRRSVKALGRGPMVEALGAQGSTTVPVAVEPGRCYFAAFALMRGHSRGLRLSAAAGARSSAEEVPPGSEAAGVTFCAEERSQARLSVDVPGSGVWWVLSVWLLSPAPSSEQTP